MNGAAKTVVIAGLDPSFHLFARWIAVSRTFGAAR